MEGCLALILHAHLPWVRHPEHPRFLEETWLYEAIAECYLPLLRVIEGWDRDRVDWRLTLTLTPTLCAMLRDPLLQSRAAHYIEERCDLAAAETIRTRLQPDWHAVARFHEVLFRERRRHFAELSGDLVGAFGRWARTGRLEILTCAATHALLPLLVEEPGSLRAQLAVAVAEHQRNFGCAPRGIWLPECAWCPELEPFLRAAGLHWFVAETGGILLGEPRPRAGIFAPAISPAGIAAFGRDPASARQVWSRHGGYPGDPRYREFHRDLAHDAEWSYVAPYLPGVDQRVFTGLKYHRVTGPGLDKALYDRAAAMEAVAGHAAHFLTMRREQMREAAPWLGAPPLIVAPYDAELFGHWWFEGPEFLDAVMRGAAGAGIRATHPADLLGRFPVQQRLMPATSSWGEGGHLAVWLDESNAWMQPALRKAGREMTALARRVESRPPSAPRHRIVTAAARQLLLAQASDWPFLVKMGTAAAYGERRVHEHLARFDALAAMAAGEIGHFEEHDPIFPEIDVGPWRGTGL
jgi:1,4-alpha-glucan branching enzyme